MLQSVMHLPQRPGNKASEQPETSSEKRGLSDISKSVIPGANKDD